MTEILLSTIEDKANQYSELFTDTLVVQGEATDVDILAAEGIIDIEVITFKIPDHYRHVFSILVIKVQGKLY